MPSRKSKADLSHEEIWDDSALIQSWDDALEEYNYYHSIHARGERVEDVLQEDQGEAVDVMIVEHPDRLPAEGPSKDVERLAGADGKEESLEDGEVEVVNEPLRPSKVVELECVPERSPWESNPPDQPNKTTPNGQSSMAGAANMPHHRLGTGQESDLKHLMMSWYYAGYYTGLHEGQQRVQQPGGLGSQVGGEAVEESNN